MTQKLYSVYDSKASYFLTPWPCRNEGIAKREFSQACANSECAMGKFPADFVLYMIGEYNDSNAEITSQTPPERICDGVEILQLTKEAK